MLAMLYAVKICEDSSPIQQAKIRRFFVLNTSGLSSLERSAASMLG